MIKKVGGTSTILQNPDELVSVDKLILPGVGAFDRGMRLLKENGWIDPLDEYVLCQRKPVLGICLGMQLMTLSSEEGVLPGLGWIDAAAKKFTFEDKRLKIPHMGWNIANIRKQTSLISEPENEKRYYFVHSYYVNLKSLEDQLFETNFGHSFTSGFEKENIIGLQFHPEKSHKFGMEIMKNFVTKYR